MSEKVEAAVACFREGFSCSQAILSTYGDDFGLPRETALRAAAALGAGMGRLGGLRGRGGCFDRDRFEARPYGGDGQGDERKELYPGP